MSNYKYGVGKNWFVKMIANHFAFSWFFHIKSKIFKVLKI
jgi:hypothetical protein